MLPTPNGFGFTVGIRLERRSRLPGGGVTGLNISIADGVFLNRHAVGRRQRDPVDGMIGLTAGPQVAGHAAVTITGS